MLLFPQEFYAENCRSCARIAGHVSMLADNLTVEAPHIAVARLECGFAELFCAHTMRIARTPSFRVFYRGKEAISYKVCVCMCMCMPAGISCHALRHILVIVIMMVC